MRSEKSLFLTYILWLFGGWFGLHHFYLRRDKQAFVWWSTFGGVFLLGWIRDLWRIPEYVDDANEDKDYFETLTKNMKTRKCPRFNTVRFAGELILGYFYGFLTKLALPEETSSFLVALLVCVGITIGIYLVGNIGREEGGFFLPIASCLITYAILLFQTEEEPNYMICALVCSMTFNWFRKYKQKYEDPSLCKRLFVLGFCGIIFLGLWGSFFYFNAEITTEDGETIKIRDSVNHFFKSPAWLEFSESMWQIYEQGKNRGWQSVYDEFVKALDPKGEANARKVLGVSDTATDKEIKQAYKKLAKKYHPDRIKGEGKREAEQKFMEIAEAYEILTSKKTSHSRNDNERTEF